MAPTAVPLATTSRISSCSNKEPCITAPHSDHLNPRIIGCALSRGHGGCLLGNVCYWHLADALPIASRGLVPAEKRTCLISVGKVRADFLARLARAARATFASKRDDLARSACNTLSQGPYPYYKQKVQSDGGI